MKDAEKAIADCTFSQRESDMRHSPYEYEFEFYECVRSGDTEKLSRLIGDLGGEGTGRLSKDELQSVKYHFVISVALITRYCVEGGLPMETAYSMSDYYINKGDLCRSVKDVNRVNFEMATAFAKAMKSLSRKTGYSKPTTLCIDYISKNLHSKLTLGILANNLGLSEGYLSRLFHKETGLTVNEYITREKIAEAKSLLRYTDKTPIDIANYLCFSSHSHFISVFKKDTGMTPGQYRQRHFRSDWTTGEHSDKNS